MPKNSRTKLHLGLSAVAGSPKPKATWKKNGKALKPGDGPDTPMTPEFANFKLKAAKREDAGEYELELENGVGKASVPLTIKVIGAHKSRNHCQEFLCLCVPQNKAILTHHCRQAGQAAGSPTGGCRVQRSLSSIMARTERRWRPRDPVLPGGGDGRAGRQVDDSRRGECLQA